MHIKTVIDRFEGDVAVLLAGDREDAVRWPKVLLPEGAKEGDILRVSLSVDADATRQAREEAETLLRQLLDSQAREE